MTLIVVGVIFAIKQGRAIVADANAPENWTSVLLLFLWVFALLCALGSAAMRSCLHYGVRGCDGSRMCIPGGGKDSRTVSELNRRMAEGESS